MSTSLLELGGLLTMGVLPALAQGFYRGGFGVDGGPGFYPGGVDGGHFASGYGMPAYAPQYVAPNFDYYSNGGHDAAPHWNTTSGPYGTFQWYGRGSMTPNLMSNSPLSTVAVAATVWDHSA